MYWQGFFRPDAECSKTHRGRERGEMDWKRADARMRARNAGSGCVCSCVHACACVCWSRCRWRMSVLKNSWCHIWRFLGDILLFNWPYRAGMHGTRSRTRNTHWTRALRVCVYSKDMGSKKELEVRNMEKLRYRKLEKKDLFGIWLFLLAGFLFHLSLGGFFVTQKFQDLLICFTKFAEQQHVSTLLTNIFRFQTNSLPTKYKIKSKTYRHLRSVDLLTNLGLISSSIHETESRNDI